MLLLKHGAKGQALNSVNRTPSQMAAFVGNHGCVAAINNFIPLADIEYYSVPNGLDKVPKLDPILVEPLHKFVSQVNVHPVAVLLYLQKNYVIVQNCKQMKQVLTLMSEREMKRGASTNEVLSFKFHWLATLLEDVEMTEEVIY
jgi:ankyrin repeat and MYND domain-containing protein 2